MDSLCLSIAIDSESKTFLHTCHINEQLLCKGSLSGPSKDLEYSKVTHRSIIQTSQNCIDLIVQ